MRRRRLLAVAVAAVGGCTGTDYRASGPRTPPPAPPTDTAGVATPDPVEARVQAVVRPLNEVYRAVRGPLSTFEVADVSEEDLAAARAAVADAREAVTTFSEAVDDLPAAYRSLPSLVTAHEGLVNALVTAVDLHASLMGIGEREEDDADDPRSRLVPLRDATAALAERASDLRDVVEAEPTVPQSLFLTVERTREMAAGLDGQSTAIGRLLDVVERRLAAAADWQVGATAFERGRFDDARAAFDDAGDHYRDAASLLDGGLGTDGSFADRAERQSCVAAAGVEAVTAARQAVDEAEAGDGDRAEELLAAAEATRSRCAD